MFDIIIPRQYTRKLWRNINFKLLKCSYTATNNILDWLDEQPYQYTILDTDLQAIIQTPDEQLVVLFKLRWNDHD